MKETKSIKEIAALAGVSPATVSRVINQNGRFSKETEARVNQIIAKYNYIPNMSAKGLRTNRNAAVGVIVPDITNPHFSVLVHSLEVSFFKQGYSCLICNTDESSDLERRHIQALTAQNVSGIALISATRNYPELKNIPTVYVDRPSLDMREDGVMIESDNHMGGYLATQALVQAGCRRIAIFKSIGNDANQLNRFRGFQQALAEAGVPPQPQLQLNLPAVSFEAAGAAVEHLLNQNIAFDGIMCTTDTIAAGALIALRRHGLKVPRDVLITGFDDSPLAVACGCGLTSVRQDVAQMASLAAKLLLEVKPSDKPEIAHYKLPVTLTVRDSTNPKRG